MSQKKKDIALGIAIGASVTLAVAAGYVIYTKNSEAINNFAKDSIDKIKETANKLMEACPCKCSDASEADGEIEAFYAAGEEKNCDRDIIINLDTDGDGSNDAVLIDTDGDGIADAAALDVNGDGQIDAIITGIDGTGAEEE